MQRAHHQNPTDPPRSPAASSIMHADRSDDSCADFVHSAPKKVLPAFNRTRPSPLAPQVLFPLQNDEKNVLRYKSPPAIRRKSNEKTLFLWDLEDEDDIPSDSSAEHVVSSFGISDQAVLSGYYDNTPKKRWEDTTSDPGYNHSRVKTKPTTPKQKKSSSDAAGPTSSPSVDSYKGQNHERRTQLGSNNRKEPPSGDIPQSPDEHTARLKEIMNKREKNHRKKRNGNCVVSEASSNTRTSSNVSSYADDPVNYLNDMLHSGEKKKNSSRSDDSASAVSSTVSKGSRGSKGSKNSSKASYGSDVSNTSSIFAATRAKLKGYLTSYKKKDKKDFQREPNKKSTTAEATSPSSPTRGSTSEGTETAQGTPSTLFSIQESEPDSSLKKTPSKTPQTTPRRASRQSFEEKILHLSTPIRLPHIHCAVESDTNIKVIRLPWSHHSKDASLNGTLITGRYSGPVNELIQPHGKGKLALEGNSSHPLYGTWEDGKLVSPLTDEQEAVTDDEDEIDVPVPDSTITRVREKPALTHTRGRSPNNSAPPVSSINYAVNSKSHRKISMGTAIARESAALDRGRAKAAKKRQLVRYDIGDACRTPQDMIICRSNHKATESASRLKKWDGAFVKRSCGAWTYAVLIERALQPLAVTKKRHEYFYWATVWEVDPRDEMEESMLFAIDGDGSTKIIPRRAWAKYVRRIQRNPVPSFPRRISNPLPTEVVTRKRRSQDGSDGQISDGSEHSSLNDSGFDDKFAPINDSEKESKVYPC